MDPEARNLLHDIALDPRSPSSALQMIWDAELHRAEILRHPACPQSVIAAVAEQALNSLQEPDPGALAALRHPMCPAELLLRAIRSQRPGLVAAAAACPDLPAELAAEVMRMVWLYPKDLVGGARIEEAKKLAALGWNVQSPELG